MASTTISAQAIAIISYDDSITGLTQPYVVTSGKDEVFRHATYAGCERFIQWHGYTLQDEQAIAQAEFEQHIEEQAQAISPLPSASFRKLKTFFAIALAASILTQAFTLPVLAATNECTQECPRHRGDGRRV
jgi:hypothetical protein